MNKGTVSDIKPGMLVQIGVSSDSDLGIVYRADASIFSVLVLDNINGNGPTRIDAKDIICAWDLSQLATYVISDLLHGCAIGWKSELDNAVVYRSISPEAMEMTLEEISEIVSKHLGKSVSVSVSVRESESESESESGKSESAKTEEEPNDYSESGRVEVAVGDFIKRDGITYRCVEDAPQTPPSCVGCAFYKDEFCANIICAAFYREDDKSVHFVKAEEVEPGRDVFVVPDNDFIEYDAPIGEEFEIKGLRYRVIEDTRDPNTECDGCALKSDGLCDYYRGFCGSERVDGKTILFKRVHTEDDCKSSETADMCKDRKLNTDIEIHNLDEVEPAIGDIIEEDGKKLKVVEGNGSCTDCYFCDDAIYGCKHINCFKHCREDGKHIILQEVKEEK